MAHRSGFCGAASLASALLLTSSAGAAPQLDKAPRVVNVTSDSAPGWTPSIELERQATKVATDFITASDADQPGRAFALLTPQMQSETPLPAFTAELKRFNAEAGASLERRFTTLTWTKDPAQAPAPGVYAAFDLVSRFAGVGRHCGYLVLYQPPSGGDFRVSRTESNYITDANFNAVGGDAAWAKLSKNCPNLAAARAGVAPLAEVADHPADQPDVAATLAALRTRTDVAFRTQGGWTIVEDKAHKTLWTFPPIGNPAYPSAVKRKVVQRDGGAFIDMDVNCEATKAACDDLVRDFQALTARMKAELAPKSP